MNDLAEEGLRLLQGARERVAARPLPVLAAVGVLASAGCVYAGGRVGTGTAVIPLTDWLGLLHRSYGATDDIVPAIGLLVAIVALCVCWLVTLRVLRVRAYRERAAWLLGGVWALPFVVGPPILDGAVYNYVGQGLISRVSKSPYLFAPTVLGHDAPIVAAIDPQLRSAHSTAGPLSTFGQHMAVTIAGGEALVTVVLYRALAVVCLAVIGVLAAELGSPRRTHAVALTVLNPLLLIYVVSAAHLEGLLAVLLLATLVSAARRRWLAAVVLACAAGALHPVALVAVPAVITAHCLSRGGVSWRRLGRDVLLSAVCLSAAVFSVRHGLNWIGNLPTITRGHTPYTPAILVGDMFAPIVRAASVDDLAAGGRVAALAAAAFVVLYLLATFRSRPLAHTVGYSLLAMALLAPVVHPWYAVWALICLVPYARGALHEWVLGLSCLAVLLRPPGFDEAVSNALTAAAALTVAVVLLARARARQRPEPPLISRTAGRTSAR